MELLLAEGFAWNSRFGGTLAGAGHLCISSLAALHDRGYSLDGDYVAWQAAANGHLSVLEWAVDVLGLEVYGGERLLERAADSGRVEVMSWVGQRGGSWRDAVMSSVAASGCEEAMEWAVEQGCPLPTDGLPYMCAAYNRDLAALRCLRRLGCPWGPVGAVFTCCVECGLPLPALQWLLQEGCPVDWAAAVAAASHYNISAQGWLEVQQRLNLPPVRPPT